jgi:hypothetical protein
MRLTRFPGIAVAILATVNATAEELPFLKPTESYSGIRIITTPMPDGTTGEIKQRVYWTPDKIRTETAIPGMSDVNIVRQDLGVMWIMPPGADMCIEISLDQADSFSMAPGPEAYEPEDMKFTLLGEESYDGLPVRKYEVISVDETGENRALFWVTEQNIPVKMEVTPAAGEGKYDTKVRLEKLQIGPQASDLFESDKECMAMPMPGGSP